MLHPNRSLTSAVIESECCILHIVKEQSVAGRSAHNGLRLETLRSIDVDLQSSIP